MRSNVKADEGRSAQELATRLRRSVALLQRGLRGGSTPSGPTGAQLSALGALHRAGGALATGELAALERLQPQSVTRLVATLARRGWLRRRADPDDARRIVLEITAAGRSRLASEVLRRDRALARALERCTTLSERRALDRVAVTLERLAAAIAASDDGATV